MEALSDSEVIELTDEDVSKAKHTAIKRVISRFYGYVEYEDLSQVAALAEIEHPRKFHKFVIDGNALGYHQEIHRVCALYAHKEKAAALGYRVEDLFFYSKKVLREVIPAVLEHWDSGDEFEFEYVDRALWLDIENALAELSEADYQIVVWAFRDGNVVADRLGIGDNAASNRVDRVLRKLQETLGGGNPAPRRHAKSNAAARAETSNQWLGEA